MSELRGARVLVTGAAGFIGANLTRALLREGAEVHALVRPKSDLWRLDGLHGVRIHAVGLEWAESIGEAFDLAFHLATSSGHPTTEKKVVAMFSTSILGLAALLRAIGFARLIHFGSSLEYGPQSRPLRETDKLEPSTKRGLAKLREYEMVRLRGQAVILRPFSVYGPWEKDRLIPTAMLAALHNQPMDLTVPGIRRDFVFVEDVVEAALAAAFQDQARGVINIGSGVQFANEEVVALVQEVTGRTFPVQVGRHPLHPPDTGYWVADIRKARRMLGWQPRHTLREGLQKTWEWFRARGRDAS
jgi:nucleoside-diphosphate-sugar epimerase